MNDDKTIAGAAHLAFFGRISASISHELKNALAIINENAGLLDDFSAMAEKGVSLDPLRLRRLSEIVQKQIRRADRIVNRMNRFAHSVDTPVKSVVLEDELNLFIDLARRSAQLKEIDLEPGEAAGVPAIRTSPFVLMNLIAGCLDHVMAHIGPERRIRIRAVKSPTGGVDIRISGAGENAGDRFPAQPENDMAHTLNAGIRLDPAAGEIVLSLPAADPAADTPSTSKPPLR